MVCSSGLSAFAVCLSELLCTKFLSRGCKSSCACGQQNLQTFWNKIQSPLQDRHLLRLFSLAVALAAHVICMDMDKLPAKAPPIGGPIIGGNMGPRFGIPLPSKVRHNVWMIHSTSCLALREIDLAYKTAIRIYHLKFKNMFNIEQLKYTKICAPRSPS